MKEFRESTITIKNVKIVLMTIFKLTNNLHIALLILTFLTCLTYLVNHYAEIILGIDNLSLSPIISTLLKIFFSSSFVLHFLGEYYIKVAYAFFCVYMEYQVKVMNASVENIICELDPNNVGKFHNTVRQRLKYCIRQDQDLRR